MVKIRLRRTGAKKKPSYRLVVTNSRTPRDGRFIEIIGHYNPRTEPSTVEVHEDRALYWLSVGAQPTDPVRRLFENLGTLDRFARLKDGQDLEEILAEAASAKSKAATQASADVQTDAPVEAEVAAVDKADDSEEVVTEEE